MLAVLVKTDFTSNVKKFFNAEDEVEGDVVNMANGEGLSMQSKKYREMMER